jgi:hypothetical protein
VLQPVLHSISLSGRAFPLRLPPLSHRTQCQTCLDLFLEASGDFSLFPVVTVVGKVLPYAAKDFPLCRP